MGNCFQYFGRFAYFARALENRRARVFDYDSVEQQVQIWNIMNSAVARGSSRNLSPVRSCPHEMNSMQPPNAGCRSFGRKVARDCMEFGVAGKQGVGSTSKASDHLLKAPKSRSCDTTYVLLQLLLNQSQKGNESYSIPLCWP